MAFHNEITFLRACLYITLKGYLIQGRFPFAAGQHAWDIATGTTWDCQFQHTYGNIHHHAYMPLTKSSTPGMYACKGELSVLLHRHAS